METTAPHENDDKLDQKKAIVTGQLQKRDEGRVADLLKRKKEKESTSASNEQTGFFEENFSRAIKGLEDKLSSSTELQKADLIDHFDGLSVSLQQTQKFVSDSAMFLPAYQVEKAQEVITKMTNEIQAKRNELIPKKKFAFKSKKNAPAKPKTVVPTDEVDNKKSKPLDVKLGDIGFTDKVDETLIKTGEEIRSGDVTLARLTNCTVKVLGSPSTLHMSRLRNCTILSGPVSSSIFVDDCRDCIFVLPCQQLRVHTTTESTFYLHVTSRAIIEDCNTLKFAKYNLEYEGLDEHYQQSGLDRSRNTWNDVDDFNWLASDAHSPNWTILEESLRQNKWDI